jgi:hypothetical protein
MLLVVVMMAFSVTISFPTTAKAADSYPEVSGTVAEVQKYGNLTMDIKPQALYDAG